MVCVKCGREAAQRAKFCPYCGEKIGQITAAEEKPIYEAEVKGMLRSGRLIVYPDRTELITNNIQKTVFQYSALISVKKGLDRINFIMEDGQTVPCAVSRKNIHEAFVYIDQAVRPYIAERKNRLLANGIHYSFVSSQGLNGGVLDIGNDRVQFRQKSGQNEIVSYRDVKSVCISMGLLQFSLFDGTSRSFSVDKDIRDEVLSFVEGAVAPYLAERKEALLSMGIYYSFLNGQGVNGGTVDILKDRVEYKFGSGQSESVFFQDVRTARPVMGGVELSLTNGMVRTFAVDKEVRDEVLSFIEEAVRPYETERTAGFETVFGVDEKIEINEERAVFHIIRQGGRMITAEYPVSDIVTCERTECGAPGSVLGGVLSGGIGIVNGAAGGAGVQEAPGIDDKINYMGVLLTIRTQQGLWTEGVRFGDFSLGMSRTNKKYDRYSAEVSGFMDYLGSNYPACELIIPKVPQVPALPAPEEEPAEVSADIAVEKEALMLPDTALQKDQFGIGKYIEGVSGFIRSCETPMMIAIQGSGGSGENDIMRMLFSGLEQEYQENLVWFNTWEFTQADFGAELPMIAGNRLVSQLAGTDGAGTSDRAVKMAKGVINIVSGFISQGGTDGQNLTDALFGEHSPDSARKLAAVFSDQVRVRCGGEKNKVIIFVDDLDRFTPAQSVELLEGIKNYFWCRGCVFVIAADYDFIISGAREKYRSNFDDNKGKDFFDKLFQVSFRVPVSGYNILNYVKDKLEQMEIHADDGAEQEVYADLIKYSIGSEPGSMNRLFNSYLLLKNMADEEMFQSKNRRLMLFALLCMQTAFRSVYDYIVRMKDKITPAFLLELCKDGFGTLDCPEISGGGKAEFGDFAGIFRNIIDTDKKEGISEEECSAFAGAFAEVLDFSSITSK